MPHMELDPLQLGSRLPSDRRHLATSQQIGRDPDGNAPVEEECHGIDAGKDDQIEAPEPGEGRIACLPGLGRDNLNRRKEYHLGTMPFQCGLKLGRLLPPAGDQNCFMVQKGQEVFPGFP